MTEQEKQRPNLTATLPVVHNSSATERLGDLRQGLGEIVSGMQDTLNRLGIDNAERFIQSNRQSGGQ